VNSASCELRFAICELQLLLTVPVAADWRSRSVIRDSRFTGRRWRHLKTPVFPQPFRIGPTLILTFFITKAYKIIPCSNVYKSWITLYKNVFCSLFRTRWRIRDMGFSQRCWRRLRSSRLYIFLTGLPTYHRTKHPLASLNFEDAGKKHLEKFSSYLPV